MNQHVLMRQQSIKLFSYNIITVNENFEEMEDYLFKRNEAITRASASTSDINCTWRNFKTLINSACNLFILTFKLSNKPSPI